MSSRIPDRGYDVSRRSYDFLDPAGRALFLVDNTTGDAPRAWPVLGNVPRGRAGASLFERTDDVLRIVNTTDGIRTTIEISLPGARDPAEHWTITVENLSDASRRVQVCRTWNGSQSPRRRPRPHAVQRLFAEIEYTSALHAVLAWTSTRRRRGSLLLTSPPMGSYRRVSTSSAAPGASGVRASWRPWPFPIPGTPRRIRPSTRSAA